MTPTLAAAGPAPLPLVLSDPRLRATRRRQFVGRDAELALVRSVLAGPAGGLAVVFLHGPAGIGKSTLLVRLADEAQRSGRPVVFASDPWPSPADGPPPVVLVDDLAGRPEEERWLRRSVLPAFPAGSVFVVAARRGPSLAWRTELGWDAVLRPVPVPPFGPAEAVALLDACGVPADRRDEVVSLAGGNPLALRVGARVVADGGTDLRRTVSLATCARLVGNVPTPAHRAALQVCAQAAWTDEDLLRAAVPEADAAELFGWLRDRPFVTEGERGLQPSAVVRTVVATELRWRDPVGSAARHERVERRVVARARTAGEEGVLPLVADVLFLRGTRAPDHSGGGGVREAPYRPGDRAELCRVAARTGGPGSVRVLEHWLDRQPEAFHVYRRDGDPAIAGAVGLLRVTAPDPADRAADPALAAAWSATGDRAGGHLGLVRLTGGAAADVRALMLLRIHEPLIRDDRLAGQVIACADPGGWAPELESTHARLPSTGPDTLFVRTAGPGTDGPAVAWDRAGFEAEVRQVLRSWHRPDVLAGQRITRARLAGGDGSGDPVTVLRAAFSAALVLLRDDPRRAKYHRALAATFLHGAPTQEAAAERLGLPFSTYRRHLARGLADLSAVLWAAETGLPVSVPGRAPH